MKDSQATSTMTSGILVVVPVSLVLNYTSAK